MKTSVTMTRKIGGFEVHQQTKEQLKELHTVEEKHSFAIDMGYIKTFEQLMSSMRKIWNEKYNPVLNLN